MRTCWRQEMLANELDHGARCRLSVWLSGRWLVCGSGRVVCVIVSQDVETLSEQVRRVSWSGHACIGVRFEDVFDGPVDQLPPSMTRLTFGCFFNHSVNQLPPNITHLTFGTTSTSSWTSCRTPPSAMASTSPWTSYQPASHISPSAITSTIPWTSCHPPSITHVIFGRKFKQSTNKIPTNIAHIAKFLIMRTSMVILRGGRVPEAFPVLSLGP
eukprot:TRINITY_DN23425_c0_g3_i1.p1 TRINITY_DN23425_c0_g3~~TRINITY_DN23425_c0_g3_i1.p1  ORF type:complete len:214 (+),score=24.84 TRINITY_DN23425_c0_g3_i1:83-724(+)